MKQDLFYDAPRERVYAMLTDPSFREEVCDAQHVLRRTVKVAPHEGDRDGADVEIERVQPITGVPAVARGFVGAEITIRQTETWSSPSRADLVLSIPGKPGEMRGTVTLEQDGDGTVETVDAEVQVTLPLVGGKLEKLIVDTVRNALDVEHEVGSRRLSG
jgi:uncharacterized protein YndB with AHSA1/START domain